MKAYEEVSDHMLGSGAFDIFSNNIGYYSHLLYIYNDTAPTYIDTLIIVGSVK